jgi:anti-anti-sigma factor
MTSPPRDALDPGDGGYACLLRRRDRVSEIALGGELDLAAVARLNAVLREALESATIDTLVIDLTAVTFIDSTTLRWLIHARRRAHASGARLTVQTVPGAVHDRLTIAGLEQYLWA